MKLRSFIRMRYSSYDGKQYFAIAKELFELDFYTSHLEIQIKDTIYTVRGYVNYDKKIIIYTGHGSYGKDDKEATLNIFKSEGWFELSPGDPELPPLVMPDITKCTCNVHPDYCEVHAA